MFRGQHQSVNTLTLPPASMVRQIDPSAKSHEVFRQTGNMPVFIESFEVLTEIAIGFSRLLKNPLLRRVRMGFDLSSD